MGNRAAVLLPPSSAESKRKFVDAKAASSVPPGAVSKPHETTAALTEEEAKISMLVFVDLWPVPGNTYIPKTRPNGSKSQKLK